MAQQIDEQLSIETQLRESWEKDAKHLSGIAYKETQRRIAAEAELARLRERIAALQRDDHSDEIARQTIAYADAHEEKGTWRNRSLPMWFVGLVEEVGELAEALEGRHEHAPQLELMQIASCAINMWRKMERDDVARLRKMNNE